MNKDRLQQLLGFYEDNQNDPFTIYAIANEYKDFDQKKALHYYEILVNKHPNYVATYYHLALLYLDLGKATEAEQTFKIGIQKATEQNEKLLLRELKNAYDEFLMDY